MAKKWRSKTVAKSHVTETGAAKSNSTTTAARKKLANRISAPRTVILMTIADNTPDAHRAASLVQKALGMTWTSALRVQSATRNGAVGACSACTT
jgi:hypothetical protein